MTNNDPVEAVPEPLYSTLGESAWQRLRERMHARTCVAGEILVTQGELAPDFFVVLSGSASVTAARPRGERLELGRIVPGECIGEMSLLTHEPASAEVSALTDMKLLVLSQEELVGLGSVRSQLFEALSAILAIRLQQANARLVAHHETTARVVCCRPDLLPALAELPDAIAATTSGRIVVLLAGKEVAVAASMFNLKRADMHLIDGDPVSLSNAISGETKDILVICDEPTFRDASEQAASSFRVATRGTSASDWGRPGQGGDLIVVDAAAWTVPNIRRLSETYGRPVAGIIPSESSGDGAPRRPIDKLARVITERTVGVAFGAGAAKGLAHVGVLRALDEIHMPIDMVSGSSIGSAVAACVASGMPPEEFAAIVTRVAKRAIRPTLPIHSFLSNAAIKDELRHIVGEQRIEDLNLPLSIVAVDIYRRAAISFTNGLLWPRIAASMAIPGVYPASAAMGSYLVDGGVLSPVPVRQCRELGAGIVVGVRLTATATSPRDDLDFRPNRPYAVEAFIRSFDIMLNRISEMSREPADVNVEICIEGTGGIRDFERVSEISRQGYTATLRAASDLRARLPYIGDAKAAPS